MLGPRKAPGYNLAMPLSRLFLAMLMALFSIAVAAAQTDTSGAKLIEDFRKAKYFFNQFEIGKKIVAFNDRTLLDNLKDLLSSEDRHVRGNAAFLFASLGDSRGLGIIAEIIQDTSYRVEGQGQPIAPGDGKYHVEGQIRADRYYAVHLLGELKDVRALPILIPLLKDTQINYKVAWALGQIADKSAFLL
jgi:PBS lyase HEAT-like repeat